jgi:hypothetical protein
MEYITYILIIFGIMALCFVLLQEKARDHKLKKQATKSTIPIETTRVDVALNRETLNVPIPWGWPGHDEHVTNNSHAALNAQEVHGVSESLHRFADRLLSEKQTIESSEYLLKKDVSLRALLEDRYGRAYRAPQVNNRNTQATISRDAGKPLVMEPLHEVKTPWGW